MYEEERKNYVGRDSDSGWGWLIGIFIFLMVVSMIVALMVYGGVFIGGFHSLKNYFVSLKHNVYDANKKPVAA